MEGWIKIHRKLMEDTLYFSEPFTKMQAWVDLLLLAQYEDKNIYIRGQKVKVHRGQISHSKEALAKRWQWSKGKVLRFLDTLVADHKIELQNSRLIGLISITNYNKYQVDDTTNRTTNRTTDRTTKYQKDEPQTEPQKKDVTNCGSGVIEDYEFPGSTTNGTTEVATEIAKIELPYKNKEDISLIVGQKISENFEDGLNRLRECYEILLGNRAWIETLTMNTRASGCMTFTVADLKSYLKKFFIKLSNEGEIEKAPRDAMSHFARWLKLEIEHESNRANITTKQDANTYAQQQFLNYYANAHCGVPGRGEGE